MATETMDGLIRTLVGVDASRRVGWAKYYDESERLVNERYLGMRRAGLFVGLVQGAVSAGATAQEIEAFLEGVVDELLHEQDDQGAVDDGIDSADGLVRELWGRWDRAIFEQQSKDLRHLSKHRRTRRLTNRQAQRLLGDAGEIRCPVDGVLLGTLTGGLLRLKCRTCRKRHGYKLKDFQ